MTTTDADCYSLLVTDGLVAAVTHAHLKLEPHEGDGGALGRTFAADCLATLPAVVLSAQEDTNTSALIKRSYWWCFVLQWKQLGIPRVKPES